MRFEIRALQSGNAVTTLTLDATSEQEAGELARGQGYAVLKISPVSGFKLSSLTAGEGKAFPLSLFTQELLTLLEAGLAVVEAIETLKEKEAKADRQRVLASIVEHLYQGQSLSQTLEKFPTVFPPLYIATVRASERTGDLPEALGRYVAYQVQIDIVKKKIVSAAIYPLMLGATGLLVVAFLLGYVVPRFSQIFSDLGRDVPFMSRMLIKWGNLVQDHGGTIVLVLVGSIAAFVVWISRPASRAWLFNKLTAIPAVGENFRVYQLARFYRTVGMLLRGGMPIMSSLTMTTDLLRDPLRGQLADAAQQIREGMPISTAMETHGLTTPVSLRMLRVGERTGRMGEMMERIAKFYDDEIARWVDWFVRLFEPLLMAFIGVVIGAIVVMMYFPIFELAGSIE